MTSIQKNDLLMKVSGNAVAAHSRERGLLIPLAALFMASLMGMLALRRTMPALCGPAMDAGWAMTIATFRLPGEAWGGAMISYLAMWGVMTVAMMLPAMAAVLLHDRGGIGESASLGWERVLVASGYFLVWTLLGFALFLIGERIVLLEMRWPMLGRHAPALSGAVMMIAGWLQFTPWKLRHLTYCRAIPAISATPLIDGLRLGISCVQCCAGMTAVSLALGWMDLRVMTLATLAIAMERSAPWGEWFARGMGMVLLVAGVCFLARLFCAGIL